MSVHESPNLLDSLAVFFYIEHVQIFFDESRKKRKERRTKMDFFNKISLSNSSSWRHLKSLSCVRSTSLHVPISVVFSLLISSLIQIRNLSISDGFLAFSFLSSSGSIKSISQFSPWTNCYHSRRLRHDFDRWDDMTAFLPAFEYVLRNARLESSHLPRLPHTHSKRKRNSLLKNSTPRRYVQRVHNCLICDKQIAFFFDLFSLFKHTSKAKPRTVRESDDNFALWMEVVQLQSTSTCKNEHRIT